MQARAGNADAPQPLTGPDDGPIQIQGVEIVVRKYRMEAVKVGSKSAQIIFHSSSELTGVTHS